MRTLFSLAFGIFFSSAALAQSWQMPQLPQEPQPATIQPANVVRFNSGTPSTSPAFQNKQPDAMAIYEADRRRLEQEQRQEALQKQQILDEIADAFGPKTGSGYAAATLPGNPEAAAYVQAYNQLNNMLTGQQPASLKQAVFIVENAWFDNKMNYAAYDQRIRNLVEFARQKMRQDKADTGNEAKNYMLFRLLSEPLTITDPRTGKKATSTPLHYDFDDFYGREDWTKMFVTKLLNTGYGQCHSMPLLFNILAEEFGAKAYMSFGPSHCFAKYQSGSTFKNVELTNGHITTDAFVLASGYIKASALRSHIYLDTVGLQQQIAFLIGDLAAGYMRKFGSDYFVGRCIETAQKYYPNDAHAMAMKANYITDMFKQSLAQLGGMPKEQVLRIPNMKKLHDAMLASYADLDNAGYAEMHAEEYEDWLKSADEQKRKQDYELFLHYQKTHKPTLSNGAN